MLLPALLAAACDDDATRHDTPQVRELTVPDLPDQWTYLSLHTGEVLGTCALADTLAQLQWAARTDWDLALCNGMIRTNSGASGMGNGGLLVSPSPFSAVHPADFDSLETDRSTLHYLP